MTRDTQDRLAVVNIGVVGDEPGGMAQVVNEYLSWTFRQVHVSAVRSTKGPHDILSPIRTILVIAGLVKRRLCGRFLAAVHMSQGGSFVREGIVVGACNVLRIPTCVHLHGSNFVGFAKSHPRLVRQVLGRADGVISLTEDSTREVRRLLGSTEMGAGPRLVQLSNAVTIPASHAEDRKRVVLFAGEVGVRKGVDTLLAAWDDRLAGRGWELWLAGPVTAQIRRLAETASPDVKFLGAVPRQRVLQMVDECGISALPSTAEALPIFLLEAMASGCPVVSTTVGEIPGLVAPDTGLLVEPGDVPALAIALDRLMTDEEARRQMGLAARSRVEALFSPTSVAASLEDAWLAAAGRRASRSLPWAADR